MADPWSKIPTCVMMRFDRGISRIQLRVEYWKTRRIGRVNWTNFACRTRKRIAGSLKGKMGPLKGEFGYTLQ
jgi:hypothetical protein